MLESHSETTDRESPEAFAEPPAQAGAPAAVIGAGIQIKGEIAGTEDLTVNGRVEGTVELADHQLTVGSTGRLQANLSANRVTINGDVQGDIVGSEKVIVSSTGRVRGNIVAPRVSLEDGAKFKGSIDMDPSDKAVELRRPSKVTEARPATSPRRSEQAAPTATKRAS